VVYIPEGLNKTLAQITDEEREKRKSKERVDCDSMKVFANWYINNRLKNE
jgi:hypothetical protein